MSVAPNRTAGAEAEGSRPDSHAPSRVASLSNHPHVIPSARKRKSVTTGGSVNATGQKPGRAPTPSWRIESIQARTRTLINDGYNSDSFDCRPAKDVSRRNSLARSSDNNSHSVWPFASCSTATRSAMRPVKVQRWDGLSREASEWDGLRRDPELWFEDGDCLVHLHARGQSRRGPAFCVPFQVLKEYNCGSMFSLCFVQTTGSPRDNSLTSKQLPNSVNLRAPDSNKIELFVPAPDDLSREAAFKWHIATRNFFAFIFGKPLVGEHLGQALVDLQERMHLFRSGQINNSQDFLVYADAQGYRDLVHSPDYALAMLYYTEHYKLRDLWIDAFVHCVGMNESLAESPEFAPLSRLTKALITRAYLEMDIHLGRVTKAVRNFLEDDLSPAYLGLPDGARAHLDKFRSFLHGFYVEKFGYWPPPKGSAFSKALFKSMYFDFRNLHDFLVDRDSTTDMASQKPASGGICVLQNVASFDQRHKFLPLPHPLPLLPSDVPVRRRTESQKTLKALTLGSKQGKTDRYLTARASLTSATNSNDFAVSNCAIVREYERFERVCALNHREEKVTMADARKVRWLLIYGTLQCLASALRAPKQVRDIEGPKYPMCCLIAEQSPWQAGTKVLTSPLTQSINIPDTIDNFLSRPNDNSPGQATPTTSTIQPDCQTQDYFSHTNVDTTSAPVSVEIPAPLRISSTRRNSISRSVSRLSLPSLSSRRNSMRLKSTTRHELPVQEHGNGPNDIHVEHPSVRSSIKSSSIISARTLSRQSSVLGDESHLHPSQRTPTLETVHMDDMVSHVASRAPCMSSSSSQSTISVESPIWSDEDSSASSKSSLYAESVLKSSPAEESGLLGGLVSFDSASVFGIKKTSQTPTPIDEFRFSFESPGVSFAELLEDSSPEQSDSAIGIALSAPETHPADTPRPTPMAALSLNNSPTKTSFSPDPMRDDHIDIFSALEISSRPANIDYEKAFMPVFSRMSSVKVPQKVAQSPTVPRNASEKAKPVSKRRSIFNIGR